MCVCVCVCMYVKMVCYTYAAWFTSAHALSQLSAISIVSRPLCGLVVIHMTRHVPFRQVFVWTVLCFSRVLPHRHGRFPTGSGGSLVNKL